MLDPTGLYQLRARSYDPGTGRFISTDPAAAGPSDPYVSAYAYANGNPIRYTDPSGRDVGGICVAGEFIPIFPFVFVEGDLCIIASESGQVGVSITGGGGGGVGVGASGGVGVIYSSAQEIYDHESVFGVVGASGVAGVGLQQEDFFGAGHCGQLVVGGSSNVVVGAEASVQGGATFTQVYGLGARKSACAGSNGK